MEQVTRQLRGDDATLVPMLMPGVTDCRFFRQKWNTNAYGFSLFDKSLKMSELVDLAHGTNERVPLETLRLTSDAYMEIVRRFLG
jgi:acetylornithine deacetylase/succinyl-diaminopimelate desuccinylase-like protein